MEKLWKMASKCTAGTRKHCAYGACNSSSRYSHLPHMERVFFVTFPKPKRQPEKCDRWIQAMGRAGFGREKVKPWTYVCSKHFIGGKGPSQEHPDPIPAFSAPEQHFPKGKSTSRFRDPVPADSNASKSCKPARRPRAGCPVSKPRVSKQRKLRKNTTRYTQNENIADYHSQQQGTSGAAVQASTPGPAGQNSNDSDYMSSINTGYDRQNVSAPAVKLKQRQRATSRRRKQLQTKQDKKCSDSSVRLHLSNTSPLDFSTDVTFSTQAIQNTFVKQMLIKMEPPKQQNWSPSMDQEDEKPKQIKEEIEEVDITQFIFSPVPVKSEDEEEKPPPSELHHSWIKESVGSDPKDTTLDSSEMNVGDGNWEESSKRQSEFFPVEIKEESFGDIRNDNSKEDQTPPQVKEEQEADVTQFTFNPVLVKSEDDEEETPEPSELHHNWNDESTDSVGSDPDQYLESDLKDETLDSSETDVSDGNWEESNEPESDFFSMEINEMSVGDKRNVSPKRIHSGEKPFSCSVCFQCFRYGKVLSSHKNIHDNSAFRCNVCNVGFGQKCFFVKHMKIHTGETLFSLY